MTTDNLQFEDGLVLTAFPAERFFTWDQVKNAMDRAHDEGYDKGMDAGIGLGRMFV